jgi:hypothetical protein
MAYELKPGQGSIFKNEKNGVENRPDYTGTGMTPDGREVKFSMWVKRPDGKTPYFSVSMQYKEQSSPVAAKQPEPVKVKAEVISDDLPF